MRIGFLSIHAGSGLSSPSTQRHVDCGGVSLIPRKSQECPRGGTKGATPQALECGQQFLYLWVQQCHVIHPWLGMRKLPPIKVVTLGMVIVCIILYLSKSNLVSSCAAIKTKAFWCPDPGPKFGPHSLVVIKTLLNPLLSPTANGVDYGN